MQSRTAERASRATTVLPAPTLELLCGACGYGIVVRRPPSTCPMCGRQAWEPPMWRPFSRRLGPRDDAAQA